MREPPKKHRGCVEYEARNGHPCPILIEHLHWPYWEMLAHYDINIQKMLSTWWPESRVHRARQKSPDLPV